MTSVRDPFGATTSFTYDGSGRLTGIDDPTGADLVLGYGSYGLASVRSSNSPYRYTYVTVNSSKLLTQIQDPDGKTTTFQYTGNRLWKVTDRLGYTTTLSYHTVSGINTGKLGTITAPTVAVFENGSSFNVAPVTTLSPWHVVGVPYTGTSGTPAPLVRPDTIHAVVTEPGGAVTKFTVDSLGWGQPVATTNGLNETTTVTYDSITGLPRLVSYPTGGVDSLWHNSNGLPTNASWHRCCARQLAWPTPADSRSGSYTSPVSQR